MDSFRIIGGKKLKGEIIPQGAKNEALQIISATLLTSDKITINNIPDIKDVMMLIELLKELGVKVEKNSKNSFSFSSTKINLSYLNSSDFFEKASKIRGSIMLVGPLLARFKIASFPKPGGDKIGRRRIDTHLNGLKELGAEFSYNNKNFSYKISTKKLKGKYILLDEASVTGTANIIMASVLAEGITTIYNAACEPYIQQLCLMINKMGGKISGIGSNMIKITGVKELKGTTHSILPDMIEIGSFIGLAAMTGR